MVAREFIPRGTLVFTEDAFLFTSDDGGDVMDYEEQLLHEKQSPTVSSHSSSSLFSSPASSACLRLIDLVWKEGGIVSHMNATEEEAEETTHRSPWWSPGMQQALHALILDGTIATLLAHSPMVQLLSTARCFLKLLARCVYVHFVEERKRKASKEEDKEKEGEGQDSSVSRYERVEEQLYGGSDAVLSELRPLTAANLAECTKLITALRRLLPGFLPVSLPSRCAARGR